MAMARARSLAPYVAGVLVELTDELHERANRAQMTNTLVERRSLAGAVVAINGPGINRTEGAEKFEWARLPAEHFLTQGEPKSVPGSTRSPRSHGAGRWVDVGFAAVGACGCVGGPDEGHLDHLGRQAAELVLRHVRLHSPAVQANLGGSP